LIPRQSYHRRSITERVNLNKKKVRKVKCGVFLMYACQWLRSNLCVRCTLSLLLLSNGHLRGHSARNRFSITKDNIETCLLEWMVDFGLASFTIRLLLVTDCPSLPVLVAMLLRRDILDSSDSRAANSRRSALKTLKCTPPGLLRRISAPTRDVLRPEKVDKVAYYATLSTCSCAS